jgi:serine/threonine protein kinase
MSYDIAQSNAPAGILLGQRVEIFPNQPLPELNSPGGNAYAARLKMDQTSNLFAIVCQSPLPPRIDTLPSMRAIDNPSILKLIESGVIPWNDNSNAYAFVYQRPSASRMMTSYDETRTPLSEDAINHQFMTPMIDALVALSNAGIAHNAVRPTNIFWHIGSATVPQLGEFLSAPAGLGQPVLFESVERALATPLGRGAGTPADDCYAFGMVLALLMLGRNPMQGLTDQAIIDIKTSRGSFSAVIGSQRLPSGHIEILRGLLADDPRQRWTANDMDHWLTGRRTTNKSSDIGKRASRFFDFGGKEYWQAGPLATALAANVSEASRMIDSEALYKWLRRAMNDEEKAGAIEDAARALKQSGKALHYEDQLVSRTCMVLDPTAPIRYRGLSVMPNGIANLMAESAVSGNNVQALSEIIGYQLVPFWIEMQKHHKGDYVALGQAFERMRGSLEKTGLGHGFERVLYEANPSLPCMSPMLRNQYVTTAKALLPALERVAAGGNRPASPIDRHIAAFLVVRDKKSDSFFAPLSMPEGSTARGIGMLSLFADLQNKYGPEQLTALSSWLAPSVEPAIKRFLSRALRDAMQKQARDAINSGKLSALLRLVDDPRRVERDRSDFIAARLLHLSIQKEIINLESKLSNRDSIVKNAGKPMAASISSFLAILLICAAVLRALFSAFFL